MEDPEYVEMCLKFVEHFLWIASSMAHCGDNGAGLGASHQTGWTGIVARMMHLFATATPEQMLELGKMTAVSDAKKTPDHKTVGAAKTGAR